MAARGDPPGPPGAAAFDAFVLEYQDMVYAVAVRLLANEAEAEDVAQTVFLRAYERFEELKGEATVPGWLKTVTTNLCLNHLERYRARWRFFSEMGEAGGPAFDVAATAAEPGSGAGRRRSARAAGSGVASAATAPAGAARVVPLRAARLRRHRAAARGLGRQGEDRHASRSARAAAVAVMTMEPDDLERLVHRALADLPMPRAPRTFRPRVMAAVALPDVGHPWFTWPWPLQVAAVLLVVAVVSALGMGVADAAGGSSARMLPDSVQTGAGYVGGAAETSCGSHACDGTDVVGGGGADRQAGAAAHGGVVHRVRVVFGGVEPRGPWRGIPVMTRLIRLAMMCAICAWGPVALAQAPDPARDAPAATSDGATRARPAPEPAAPAPTGTERPTRARTAAPTRRLRSASTPRPAPQPGEERVTMIDATRAPSTGHNPGFRLGQDQIIRKGDAFQDVVVVFGNVVVEGACLR